MKDSKYITVAYKLYVPMEGNENELYEEATSQHPFQFVTGLNMTLQKFEDQIAPLAKGDSFDFTLSVEDAYEAYEPQLVNTLPSSAFEIDGRIDEQYIYEGAVVPMRTQDGQNYYGTITKITPTHITVDLNHPLAGKTLHFVGSVIENRIATNEELQETLKMLSGEGCCGGCGGSCEGGCEGGNCGGGCHGCN